MAATAYNTQRDIFAIIGAAAFVSRPRDVVAADPSSNVLTLPGHGLDGEQVLTFVVEGNSTPGAYGMPSGVPALPSGLSPTTLYYPIVFGSSDLFKVSLSDGGAAVALVTAGIPKFGVRVDVGTTMDRCSSMAAGDVNEVLTAFKAPLVPDPLTGEYPQSIVNVAAALAAKRSLFALGIAHPQYAEALKPLLDDWKTTVRETMAAWLLGRPTNPRASDLSLAPENAARVGYGRESSGWATGVL